MKTPGDETVPADVVTLTEPDVAPDGTVARMEVSDTTEKALAARPLNLTAVVPVKPLPAIVTIVPTGPLVGDRLVIVRVTPKSDALVAVPTAVVTAIFPVVAPFGTVARIDVAETIVYTAATPLNLTALAPLK